MSWQAPHCLWLTNTQSAGTRISTLFYTLPPIQKATPTWPQPALKADQLSSYFFRGQNRLTKNIYKRDAEQWRSPFYRLCWRMTVGVQRGGFGPSRATTRDRPDHAPKHCSGPFVHGRGDPLWSPSLGRTLLSTRAVIRQQSLYSARNLLIPTRPSSRRT